MVDTPTDPTAIDLEVIRARYCTGDYFEGGSICVGDISLLIAAVEKLRSQRIYSFTETSDGAPEYTQGNEKIHELHELVTAEECNGLVKTIKELRERVAELKAKKWEVQHTDTMNEIVQLGLARDEAGARAEAAEARVAELAEHLDKTVGVSADAVTRAETAEAREVELAGALGKIIPVLDRTKTTGEIRRGHNEVRRLVETALAATPAATLERAKAKDEVVTALRIVRSLLGAHHNYSPIIDVRKAQKQVNKALAKLDTLDRPAETGDIS